MEAKTDTYSTKLLKRRWLSKKTLEIRLAKPPLFDFQPGQRLSLIYGTVERDYSMVSTPADTDLVLCIRSVPEGLLSPRLSKIALGAQLQFNGPHGYFRFQPSSRPAIFVATGTGLAPFCSMVNSGITDITLLHGVTLADDLYYGDFLSSTVKNYVPCLSNPDETSVDHFSGKVTDYIQTNVTPKAYDFYLCGRREMIHDVTMLVDEMFEGSLIYTETYF